MNTSTNLHSATRKSFDALPVEEELLTVTPKRKTWVKRIEIEAVDGGTFTLTVFCDIPPVSPTAQPDPTVEGADESLEDGDPLNVAC